MATKLEVALGKAELLSQQLEAANEVAVMRDAEITKLTKELASAKFTSDIWYKQNEVAQAEVEQVHLLLDALPSAVARKSAPTDDYGQTVNFSLMTRLAAWMAAGAR